MDSSTAGAPSGEYLCYIYGQVPSTNKFSTWVELDASYKNPGECLGTKGTKVTIDGTSIWQGNSALRRLEYIANFPRSDQTGAIYYKWSMMQAGTLTMSQYEHQLVFFENHSCDLKYGGGGGANLYFYINGRSVWNTPFTANTWFNFGLRVDYSAKTCTIYHSTGSNTLAQVVAATSAPGISPEDFHLGILRVSSDSSTTKQSVFYSGVYAERTLTNNLGASCGTPIATSAANTPTSAGNTPTSAGTPPSPTSAGTPPNIPTGPGGKATVVIITYGSATSLLPLAMVLAILLAMLL